MPADPVPHPTITITPDLIDRWLEGKRCPHGDGWQPARDVPFQREAAVHAIRRAAAVFGLEVRDGQ